MTEQYGAIVVATGFDTIRLDKYGEYAYNKSRDVITSLEPEPAHGQHSLLDIIAFGRDAGKAAKAKNATLGTPNLDHIYQYADMLKEAGCAEECVSPLLLPHYARHAR